MNERRFLVPIDFSPQQDAVIAQAKVLALAWSAELVLMHCIVAPEISVVAVEPVYIPSTVLERFTRDQLAVVTQKMDEVAEQLQPEVRTRVVIKQSTPVESILAVASELKCDGIIMGSHGAGLDRFLLGSVAEAISRSADCPVIIAREMEKPSEFRNVVIGIDFSRYSAALVDLARGLAHKDATLHLVHSWQPPHLDTAHLFGDPGHASLIASLSDGLQHHAHALESFAESLPEDERYRLHVETGRPATVLLETYDSLGADAVIVGAHDSDHLENMLGTVSDRVLRHAATTVLLTEKTLATLEIPKE